MRARQIFPLLIGLLLAACSAQTQLTNTWRDTEFRGVPFKRVLVIGFGEDGANRRVFEDEFSKSLQAAGVSAIPSYTLGSGVSETDIEKVKAMVARSGADGVLTTRLVGIDKRVNVYPGQVMVMPAVGYRRGFYNYYSSAMVMPPSTYNYEVVTLETNLWQVVGEHLVWSGTTETFAPEDARKSSAEFARVIVGALRGQGLL
ncbi:MAG: hypothetical protein QG592_170 [Pseudomonadota bacterium]|nr:hypothetical protein [Pseudomonadota bacterium]MDQ5959091.1 hypothetical protein [Pseudomonadota bacterium]